MVMVRGIKVNGFGFRYRSHLTAQVDETDRKT